MVIIYSLECHMYFPPMFVITYNLLLHRTPRLSRSDHGQSSPSRASHRNASTNCSELASAVSELAAEEGRTSVIARKSTLSIFQSASLSWLIAASNCSGDLTA